MSNDFPITVVIASSGRPAAVGELLNDLEAQTRQPDHVIISVCSDNDLPTGLQHLGRVTILFGPRGSCCQRNAALDALTDDKGAVLFLDDDYVPSRHTIEVVSQIFLQNPNISGIDGTLLADGIHGPGIARDEAMILTTTADRNFHPSTLNEFDVGRFGLYGCNMAYRSSVVAGIRFDEQLPLYGWQEDIDFARRATMTGGQLVRSKAWFGVHRGIKSGRVSGKQLGYSQIANPLYLVKKGTMTRKFAASLIARNLAANSLKSITRDPWIDRRGRLSGNLLAISHFISSKLHPMRVVEI